MDDVNSLLMQYRDIVRSLIERKSSQPIFPTAQPCVSVAVDEVLRNARSSVTLIVNDASERAIMSAIQSSTYDNIRRIPIGLVRCFINESRLEMKEVLEDKGFLVDRIPADITPKIISVSFLLVDRMTLIIFDSKEPSVILIPCASTQMIESCERLIKELRGVVKHEPVETPEGGVK